MSLQKPGGKKEEVTKEEVGWGMWAGESEGGVGSSTKLPTVFPCEICPFYINKYKK